eukprot:8904132-Pyramimonas_sp.AAC.1
MRELPYHRALASYCPSAAAGGWLSRDRTRTGMQPVWADLVGGSDPRQAHGCSLAKAEAGNGSYNCSPRSSHSPLAQEGLPTAS